MKILAIRLARFGDIVLLLPALAALKDRLSGAHITFLTDARWGPLAEMCPAIAEVRTMDRIGMRDGSYLQALAEIFRFGTQLRKKRFDAAIDFHGFRETNLIAWWSGASQRLALKPIDQSSYGFCFNMPPVLEDKALHVSEMFQRVVQVFAPQPDAATPTPALVIPKHASEWANQHLPAKPFAALYVDAPARERVWPADRFASLAEHIVNKLGAPVVVITGSQRSLPRFPEGTRVLSDLSIPQLAAVIGSARILVSNDTGPMHLGPALGIPTIGIFSIGIPAHFRPTGPHSAYVQGNPIELVRVSDVTELVDRVWDT